ncbi:MAG: hypothetical protein ABSF88_13530 [Candidatus Aminicenantales bacterium]
MTKREIGAALAVLLSLAAFLPAQSVSEAAKKEKERREALKGKPTVVVTNADLSKTMKKPAVAANPARPAEGENAAAQDTAASAKEPATGKDTTAADLQAEARKKRDEKKAELEDAWNKAKDMVELLNLKMNALWLQFYSHNSMTSKDQIQKSISETYQKLQAAQAEEKKAKDELDKLTALGPQDKFPAAVIK